jgi:hypothetical protein
LHVDLALLFALNSIRTTSRLIGSVDLRTYTQRANPITITRIVSRHFINSPHSQAIIDARNFFCLIVRINHNTAATHIPIGRCSQGHGNFFGNRSVGAFNLGIMVEQEAFRQRLTNQLSSC